MNPSLPTDGLPAPLCELQHVSQEFPQPNGSLLRVLDDVGLQIRPNEVVALLGPSGCGKSTVLRILAGLLVPTRGQVLYHGKPLEGLNPGVAIVFQSFALYPWMTVLENIEVVLRAAGLPGVQMATTCWASTSAFRLASARLAWAAASVAARSRSCARRFGPMGGYSGGSFAGACPGTGGC